jgi:hypothetical protein
MEKIKLYKSPEMLVALSALFIGLLTAVISVYSAYVDREYARASVWPKLELSRSHNEKTFSYYVWQIQIKELAPQLLKMQK